ncbi:MAG: Trigger factor [Chlamydiae bacterium]|nr:Trigger factor [Chlamydiota bacterium]
MVDLEKKTYESDGFSVEAIEEVGCRLSLRVLVKPVQAQKAYQKGVKVVNKQISIPGFRKGKAPSATVIGRHSSYVEQEWKEILIQEAYRGALDAVEIYPINKESIDRPKIVSCSQEEGAVVTFSYEHYPNVPTIDFTKLSLPEIEKETISEERVEEILEQIQSAHATWEEVEGRSVEMGDHVEISVETTSDDPPKPLLSHRRLEMAEKKMSPWLIEILVGAEIGAIKEGETQIDPEADEEAKKNFQPASVRVEIHKIEKPTYPEVDDELAKKAGADSKEDLLKKIRDDLEGAARSNQKQKQIEALDEVLLETYQFALPTSLVTAEKKERLERKIAQLKRDNFSNEEIQNKKEVIEQDIEKEVDESLRLYFLNKKIQEQGKIQTTQEELNQELQAQIQRNPYLFLQSQKDQAATQELLSRLASSLVHKKTKEYALAQTLGEENS